jgi:3-hydroxymyristoyl/3-hydroxydecanoyl-(acyl carrier protein) dehydratase
MSDPGIQDVTVTACIRISAQHPSLPGHFPGQPIVPGVVLLDRIAAAAEQAGWGFLCRIAAVKFLAPLLPEQDAQLTATYSGTRLRFHIERDGAVILRGEGELAKEICHD